jgi:hypothetical protein
MHRSRLTGFVIDCEGGDLEAGGRFWSGALGRAPGRPFDQYFPLERRGEEPYALLQRVDHPARVHLDLETDDVEAEVRRLERLGATRVRKVKEWWILEAPTGHRFCVIPLQAGPLPEDANTWPD